MADFFQLSTEWMENSVELNKLKQSEQFTLRNQWCSRDRWQREIGTREENGRTFVRFAVFGKEGPSRIIEGRSKSFQSASTFGTKPQYSIKTWFNKKSCWSESRNWTSSGQNTTSWSRYNKRRKKECHVAVVQHDSTEGLIKFVKQPVYFL